MITLLDISAYSAFKLDLLLLVLVTFCALPNPSSCKTVHTREKGMLWKQKHMMWPVLATLVHPLWVAPTLSCVSFLTLLPYSILLVYQSTPSTPIPLQDSLLLSSLQMLLSYWWCLPLPSHPTTFLNIKTHEFCLCFLYSCWLTMFSASPLFSTVSTFSVCLIYSMSYFKAETISLKHIES